MDVKSSVFTLLTECHMVNTGDTVIVGVSGGADSVTLLHVLIELREALALKEIRAVHIDHGLRGEESDRDREFVCALCKKWKIPLSVYHFDVAAVAKERRIGTEEAGRQLRYEALEQEAKKYEPSRIATAHTKSDNRETVLLHLSRGCGIHGLSGIPPVRGRLIRPLLSCDREQIENYCNKHELAYCTDSTNSDISFSRNRIRHRVLPELKQINPKADQAIDRLIGQAARVDEYMTQQADEWLRCAATKETGKYSRKIILDCPVPLRYSLIYRLITENGGFCEEQHISQILFLLAKGRGFVPLPHGGGIRVTDSALTFSADTLSPEKEVLLPIPFSIGNYLIFGKRKYALIPLLREEYEQKLKISKSVFKNAVDCDKIMGDLIFRTRREGDMFHPVGRKCGKTLKKLFNEAHVLAEERDKIPLLCDEDGVIAVFGFGCDERVRVSRNTKNIGILTVVEE